MMIDWVSSRLRGMRPLSLFRPSAWPCAAGPGAADSGLAGAGRGCAPSGEFGSSSPARPRQDGHHGRPGSGGGQRVVAELGQDVAGLPEELAGLGQGGALAVLAVLDLGVVAVVGGRCAGVGLAFLITAQRSTGGPCRDSRPGDRLPSEEYTVMSSPANRTALREEENRPAPPSQQVIASAVIGPTPYSRPARTLALARCRAAVSSRCRTACIRASSASITSSAVATCS